MANISLLISLEDIYNSVEYFMQMLIMQHIVHGMIC